jgi:23S rRNA (adenine2503-C2)-methyltransferase
VLALQAVTPTQLVDAVPGVTLAEARKLVAQAHRGEPVAATSAIRKTAAEAVRAAAHQPRLEVVAETASAIDPFVKYLVAAPDGARVEAVRIPLEVAGRYTVCVSSQVGCALACAFCATGRLGLSRNLETWEIVEQVRVVRRRLTAGRIHGVVFQGMGEPMANVDAVLAAIAVMTEPCALGIDARNITVCTAGLPSGIRRLAAAQPHVRLGLSIGSALPDKRASLMPITRAHAFSDVLAAVADHARSTGLAPMWAVALLDGVNDSDDHARALAEAAHRFAAATSIRPRISILTYNAIGDDAREGTLASSAAGGQRGSIDPFKRSTREAEFRGVLADAGLASHRRYSGGSDVAAACGQLAAR